MSRGQERPVVAILSPDPDEARWLAERIVEDGLEPRVTAGAGELAALCDGPRPPAVVLADPEVPGAGAALARAGGGGPAFIALGVKPPKQLGVLRPVAPSTLSRRLAWAFHARGVSSGALSAGGELRSTSSLATLLNAGNGGRTALGAALGRIVADLGGDLGRLALLPPGGTLGEVATCGLLAPGPDARPLPILEWCLSEQRPLRIAGPFEDYPQFGGARLDPPVAELLVAPVVTGDEPLGALAVGSRVPGRLGSEKLALLVTAARLIAGTVQRGRLERAREHQDRLAMLGFLAAGVAHELSNPLAYVSTNLDFLAERLAAGAADPARQAGVCELVAETRGGVERMIGLVEDLRSAGRKTPGRDGLVDLDALARRAAVLVGAQFKHHVEFRLEPGQPPPVQAEGERLLQILLNLLINAGQAMDRHGTAVVRTRADRPWSIIEVEDDGPGVPDALVERIFEPFFTTKADGDGTGLGLAISRQIARSYGGDLYVSRAEDGGARFTLRLPAYDWAEDVLLEGTG